MPRRRGGALAKMTEEERILYLEQQRLADEEMRKNKEDMLTQFLKVVVLLCLQVIKYLLMVDSN
jgi:hypothetical protein